MWKGLVEKCSHKKWGLKTCVLVRVFHLISTLICHLTRIWQDLGWGGLYAARRVLQFLEILRKKKRTLPTGSNLFNKLLLITNLLLSLSSFFLHVKDLSWLHGVYWLNDWPQGKQTFCSHETLKIENRKNENENEKTNEKFKYLQTQGQGETKLTVSCGTGH